MLNQFVVIGRIKNFKPTTPGVVGEGLIYLELVFEDSTKGIIPIKVPSKMGEQAQDYLTSGSLVGIKGSFKPRYNAKKEQIIVLEAAKLSYLSSTKGGDKDED